MAGLFHGKKMNILVRARLSAFAFFIFWLKNTSLIFGRKKKHKPMSQIIEQGLVFNLNVNAIVLGKED